MWSTEFAIKTKASKESVWKLWEDVPNWKLWDDGLEKTELFGRFEAGTRGTLKPKGGPLTRFVITRCVPNQVFSDLTKLPLCKLVFIHTLTETAEGTEVKHRVEFSGPFTFLFSRIIGKDIQKGMPETVRTLVKMAEKNSA